MLALAAFTLATAAVVVVQGTTQSLTTQLAHASEAIRINLGYMMLRPSKAGSIVRFAAGLLPSAPLHDPLIAFPGDRLGPVASLVYSTYKITGLSNYVGLEASGAFWYSTRDSARDTDVFGYRAPDPAACDATASTRDGDVAQEAAASNCEQSSYVDSTGTPQESFSNLQYDPRTRPWYVAAKAASTPTWSSIYVFFDTKKLGITYSVPLVDTSGVLLGVAGLDYVLDDISSMLDSIRIADVTQYIFVTSTLELVASSTLEPTSSVDGLSTRLCTNTNNTLIRESSRHLVDNKLTTDGIFSYTGSDGQMYTMRTSRWADAGGSVEWTLVAAAPDRVWAVDLTGVAVHSARCVASDLDAFADDAMYPAQYLTYLAGKTMDVAVAPERKGPAQQTLWGALSSFPNTNSVFLGYKSKAFLAYSRIPVKSYAKGFFYRPEGATGDSKGCPIATHGEPLVATTIYSNSNYDPTARPWYTSTTRGKARWSIVFEFDFAKDTPVLALSFPVAHAAVVGVSRPLTSLTLILQVYASTDGVTYIMDSSSRLLAVSTGENVWLSDKSLLLATASANYLVSESAKFIQAEQINSLTTMTTTLSNARVYSLVHRPWSDAGTGSLSWRVVVVAPIEIVNAINVISQKADLSGVKAAYDGAAAAAVFSSFVFVLVIVILIRVYTMPSNADSSGGSVSPSVSARFTSRKTRVKQTEEEEEETNNPMASVSKPSKLEALAATRE